MTLAACSRDIDLWCLSFGMQCVTTSGDKRCVTTSGDKRRQLLCSRRLKTCDWFVVSVLLGMKYSVVYLGKVSNEVALYICSGLCTVT
jgi:hypothetical protein